MKTPRASIASGPSRVGAPWYREPLMWLVVLVPGTSVLMGLIMIGLALWSDDGLVVDDYYRRGLQINQALERDRAARRLELVAGVEFDARAGTTRVSLHGNEQLSAPPALRLALLHATRSGMDRVLTLAPGEAGEYVGAYVRLEPGRWYLQIDAGDWRLTGAMTAPARGRLALRYQPRS